MVWKKYSLKTAHILGGAVLISLLTLLTVASAVTKYDRPHREALSPSSIRVAVHSTTDQDERQQLIKKVRELADEADQRGENDTAITLHALAGSMYLDDESTLALYSAQYAEMRASQIEDSKRRSKPHLVLPRVYEPPKADELQY